MKKVYWLLLLVPLVHRVDGQTTVDSTDFSKSIQPFFAKNCYACHNAELKIGGLNLQAYVSSASIAQEPEKFERILTRLQGNEMPPASRPRPDTAELKLVTEQIRASLDKIYQTAKPASPRVLARRLNRTEYNNTVRDLLGIDSQPTRDFPPDDSAFGFDNIALALTVSPTLMEKYLATAERVAKEAVFGPTLKSETAVYLPTVPRRMEFTNRLKVQPPAYYSMQDYDQTGLSHPGSFHVKHRFPADGDYVIRVVGAGFRPNGSDPGQMDLWFDGKLAKSFTVEVEVEQSGFERRPDHWDLQLRVPAGYHEIAVAYPKQYHGLPAIFGGPAPSRVPYDACKVLGNGAGRCAANSFNLPEETDPERIERRRQQIERLQEDELHPKFEGMAVSEVNIIGPTNFKSGPSAESKRKIYTCGAVNGSYTPACERQIVTNLATRAYRRPVTPQETDELLTITANARKRGSSFDESLSLAIATILASPNFLFRIDREAPLDSTRTAGQYELASRLSYFLWSSTPDEELLREAGKGTLRAGKALETQVHRMLTDPKAHALVENFAGQWLEIRRLESVQPDRERYPDFDDYLRASLSKETELFFEYVMKNDRSLLDFIDGQYTFLNERLARHYGIRGITGTEFRKVDLTGSGRGGIMTQASVLTVSSYSNRTSVVLRGKWVLENILNAPPPPPPANVPSLNEDAVGATASLRQQMEAHRRNAVCAACHSKMDPLGFGLENYDAVGAWRTMDGKFPIDSSGVLPNGKTFQGAVELEKILKDQKDAFAEGLAEKMLIYALGRGLEREDHAEVRRIVARMGTDNYKFSSLILGIVNSPLFQMDGRKEVAR